MTARRLFLVLLVTGVALGVLADRVPDLPPARRDGRFVVAADLHVHLNLR